MRGFLDIASRTDERTDKRESFSSQRRCRETKNCDFAKSRPEVD